MAAEMTAQLCGGSQACVVPPVQSTGSERMTIFCRGGKLRASGVASAPLQSKFGGCRGHILKTSHCTKLPTQFCQRRSLQGDREHGRCVVRCSASGAATGFPAEDENPYEILGVNPLKGFDAAKAAYTKKFREAERQGDEATMAQLERAYDRIMMGQLNKRRQGIAFGSLEVSDDIKYADKEDLIPWRPRESKVSKNEMLINAAIAVPLVLWMISAGYAEWKPLQFLTFAFMFRIHMKLKDFFVAPSAEEDADKRKKVNFSRLLRAAGLVFGSVLVAAMIHTGVLVCYDMLGQVAPRSLLRGQELVVTVISGALLFVVASFYR